MASVHEYLKKLLYQYDCVVVPEFGAFLTHYQRAVYSETSGLYLPPRKRVAFNEALRFDDGILANYIMLHEPVTRDDAQRHISQFVEYLREQVDVLSFFELDGIGTFTRNDEGKLQFAPSLRHNFFGETFGMTALAVQPIHKLSLVAAPLEAVPVLLPGPVLVLDDEPTLTPLPVARPYWRVAAAILLIGAIGAVSYFSVIKPGQPMQSSLDPANLFRVPAAFFARTTQPNEATEKVTVVKPKTVSTETPAPVVTAETTPSPTETTTLTPAPVIAELTPKPTVVAVVVPEASKPEAAPARTGPYFTVIAGVFANKQRAEPLVAYLHKAGYADAYIMVQGKKSLRYKVAAIGSADKAEAMKSLPAISKMVGSNAWIFTH